MKFLLPTSTTLNVSVGDGKTYPVKNRIAEIQSNLSEKTVKHLLTLGWKPADDEAANFVGKATLDEVAAKAMQEKARSEMSNQSREEAAESDAKAKKK